MSFSVLPEVSSILYLTRTSYIRAFYFSMSGSSMNRSEITRVHSYFQRLIMTSLSFTLIRFLEFLSCLMSILNIPNIILLMSFMVKFQVNFAGVGMNLSLTTFQRSIVARQRLLMESEAVPISFMNCSLNLCEIMKPQMFCTTTDSGGSMFTIKNWRFRRLGMSFFPPPGLDIAQTQWVLLIFPNLGSSPFLNMQNPSSSMI